MATSSPVSELLLGLLKIRESVGGSPKAGSRADTEIRAFPRPESVATAFSQGLVATEAAVDHLHGLDLLVVAQDSSLAPWTCARGLLEAATIATWLLDTQIDTTERVGRSLAMRYETLIAQRKLANADQNPTLVAKIDRRVDNIAGIASQLGYPPINDRNGNRIGIGRRKPGITDLIEKQFDLQNVYRIFSGVAHCDTVTVSQLGFETLGSSASGGVVKRLDVNREIQRNLLAKGVELCSRALWLHMVQYGCDLTSAAPILEAAYTKCGLADRDDVRFWRNP